MFEILFFILVGCLLGTISGFLPGIGNTMMLLMIFPWLVTVDITNVVILYIGLISISQYVGSITAIYFGVPGEGSSLPAVKEGHQLFRKGKEQLAVSACAIGSFFGSILCLGLFWLFVNQVTELYDYFNTYHQAIALAFVTLIISLIANRWYISLFLACFGFMLGRIGTGYNGLMEPFLTFGNTDLQTGLPLFPVLIAFWVLPEMWKSFQNKKLTKTTKNIEKPSVKEHFTHWLKHWPSSIRGTVLGFFGGLTPGLTTIVSANLSYAVEVAYRKKKKKYKEDGDMASLVSAETANNAGAFSALLPLLILGIPIQPSEAILTDIAALQTFVFGFENFTPEFFYLVGVSLIIINFIGVFIAWPLARYLSGMLSNINLKYFYGAIIAVLLITLGVVGDELWQFWYYIWITAVLLPFGFLFRNFNTIPLIFVFILQDRLQIIFTRTFELMF